jgi:hypothetical protein
MCDGMHLDPIVSVVVNALLRRSISKPYADSQLLLLAGSDLVKSRFDVRLSG